MAEIVHILRCLRCGYEMAVKLVHACKCPSCGEKMSYITSRPK